MSQNTGQPRSKTLRNLNTEWWAQLTNLRLSMMNAKLSKQMFWHCHENGLIKMIPTIPQNLCEFQVSFPLLWIKDYPGLFQFLVKGSWLETHMWVVGYRLNCLDEPVFIGQQVQNLCRLEFGIHHRLESCGMFRYLSQGSKVACSYVWLQNIQAGILKISHNSLDWGVTRFERYANNL